MRKKSVLYLFIGIILIPQLFQYLLVFFAPEEENSSEKKSDTAHEDSENLYISTTTKQPVFDNPTEARNYRRKKTILQHCSSKNRSKREVSSGFFDKQFIMGLSDERFSLVYCRINKAASWYSISTLSKMLRWPEERFRNFSSVFRALSYEEKTNIFKDAFTFHFVREPYGRLFSTYSNKFYFPKGNWAPVGTEIVKRYRENPSVDSLNFGHDITFEEMIRFTIEEYEAGNKMDAHIRPMHENCKPCDYRYGYIGKLETMVTDWKYITQQLKARKIIKWTPTHAGQKKESKKFSEMKHFFETLKKIEQSNIDTYKLYRRAWRYFQMTGIISKYIEMPFAKKNIETINNETFLAEMDKAVKNFNGNKTELKMQKQEALMQAYLSVPQELLERLRNVVLEDCLLYDYDDRPKWVFKRETFNVSSNTFAYFSDLS